LIATDDTFDVVFEEVDDETGEVRRADTQGVLRAWRDGLDLVPLEDGGWAPLPADWLARFGDRVADLLAARSADKKLPTASLPELGALCAVLDAPPPKALAGLAPLVEGFTRIPSAELPPDLTATLRDYQRSGVDWLAFLRDAGLGAVLADDMGLGKTLQTIATFRGRCLVVCPRSVVYNWEAEIARFRPSLRTAIFHGAGRELDASADVTLTTYAVLRLDQERLASVTWDVVVLDEAQAIKNPTSQTAKAAFALPAKHRVALSGTPVENRLDELWSIMHFANPGLLGGRSDFQERLAEPIARGDASAASRLRAKIRPFVLRRLKRDVLRELPPRTDAILHVELEESERNVYDAVRAATKKEIAARLAGSGGSMMAALEALLRLRQAACHSALVPGQEAAASSNAPPSSKVQRLLEALEEAVADGHKALVFSQWTSLLDLVEPHLRNAGSGFTRLDGSTRDRAAVVAALSLTDGPPVMLVSLKAGGTGLNLVAADHVFLLDPWWNPAVEDQAADRAHRIGQERPVILYRMVARDTVEERILALQEKKRAIADVALGNADHAGGITKEELLALLD
jgi:SNF2 family DNA or RNA helicase